MATRTRTWSCISYEDTAKIQQHLENLHIAFAYQTHDKDNKPTHTHIIIQYSSVKSLTQAKKDLEGIAANNYVEQVRDTRGAIRYLSHLDNPEKAQYDRPISTGIDIDKFISDEPEKETIENMLSLIEFINSWDIRYYSDLIDTIRHYKDTDDKTQNWDLLLRTALSRKNIQATLAYLKSRDVKANREFVN